MTLFPGPLICVTSAISATATKHYFHCASPTMVRNICYEANNITIHLYGDLSSQGPFSGGRLHNFKCERLPHDV